MKKQLLYSILLLSIITNAKFENESEVLTIVNGGNTNQETWNAKTTNKYLAGANSYSLGGHYAYGKADDSLNTRNWDLNTRYTRSFKKKWAAFFAAQREENQFSNVEYRWNYDLGGKYKFIDNDTTKINSELGMRRTLESDLSGNKSNSTKLRLYGFTSNKINENTSVEFWAEYLPNLSTSDDWQLNLSPSLNINLVKTLTLKVAYLYKYDNQPSLGKSMTDYQYSTSLIARF